MSVRDGRARYAADHHPNDQAKTWTAEDITSNPVTRGRAIYAAQRGDKDARALLTEVDAAYAALQTAMDQTAGDARGSVDDLGDDAA